jgi:hypothetical protein
MTGLVQSLGTPFPYTVLVEYPLQERHDVLFRTMLEEI